MVNGSPLTPNEQKVFDFLNSQPVEFYSPMWIAQGVFPGTSRSYSWASPICKRLVPICKRLVRKGLIVQNNQGRYKVREL